MQFRNSTHLDSTRLEALFTRHTWPFRHDRLKVHVRPSRGADFSGSCFYADARIFVNLGPRNRYPYHAATHLARARSNRTHWWRETYRLVLADAYQLALFVYLHELYHHLVKTAGRCPRRKEAMCDRFAAAALVDHFGARVVDSHGRPVARQQWDFQDVHAFVAAAPKTPATLWDLVEPRAPRPIPVTIVGVRTGTGHRQTVPGHRRQA
jgi:hypothetical protein